METTKEEKITRNYLDTASFWREYPDRDVEFVRWYPCDIDYLSQEQVFSVPKTYDNNVATFYVHVPFCNQICTSCPYNKYSTRSHIVKRYVDALKNEITTYSEMPYFKDVELLSGYIGGGTPTTLTAEQLDDLLGHIKRNFNIKKGASITVESTPVDITPRKVEALLKNGVDRISLGVQTFHDPMLRYLGRSPAHTREKTIKTINMLKREGMENICIDLMIGIPGQTMDLWEVDIEMLMSLPINSCSLYLYLVLPASEAFFKLQSGQIPQCPTTDEQDAMYWKIVDKLLSNNYVAVTNNDFGGPVTEEWNDMGVKTYPIPNKDNKPYKILDTSSFYLTDHLSHSWYECGDMLSFGPGAYGYLNQHMFLNEPDIEKYIEMCSNGNTSISMGSPTNSAERMARSLVLGLKLLRVKRSDFVKAHGVDLYSVFKEKIDSLVEKGLLELTEDALQVTFPKGWHYIDNISKTFYTSANYRLPQPSPQSTDILKWRRKRISQLSEQGV